MGASRDVIETVRREVEKGFRISEAYSTHGGLGFLVDPPLDLEESYESLRRALRPLGMVVSVEDREGRMTVFVANLPLARTRPSSVNKLMLLLTLFTTVISGSLLWSSFGGDGDMWSGSSLLWGALSFALPLLLILGTHELSHYLMARRYGLSVSLPFFIPSIPPVGTFGAFISIREPLPSRKALVDIGLAGPIGGFLVAIPVLAVGYSLSMGDSSGIWQEGLMTYFGMPLIMQLMMALFPVGGDLLMHPTMFAGWLGLFITGINLLPAGQLDGGHVSRAVLGGSAKHLAHAVMIGLVLLSFVYTGWLIFAFLILMLGVSHPPPLNDISPLDRRRYAVAALGLVLLLTCFIPIPMEARMNEASLSLSADGGTGMSVAPGGWAELGFTLENDGNMPLMMSVALEGLPSGWHHRLEGGGASSEDGGLELWVEEGAFVSITLSVHADAGAAPGVIDLRLVATGGSAMESLDLTLTVLV